MNSSQERVGSRYGTKKSIRKSGLFQLQVLQQESGVQWQITWPVIISPFSVQAITPKSINLHESNISKTIQLGKELVEQYEPLRTRWIDAIRSEVRKGADPIIIARCMMRILTSKRPRFMYVSGPEAGPGIWIHRWLPEKLSKWIYRTRYGVTMPKSDQLARRLSCLPCSYSRD
jgi:hypothetical protein